MANRIIVVDDNELICDSLKELFSSEGMEVASFTDPTQALEYVREKGADLAVVDVRMPRMDGFSLVARLRELSPRIRTVMVSSHYDDEEEMARSIMRRHCDVAFPKPFSLKRILIAVLGLLAEPFEPPMERVAA